MQKLGSNKSMNTHCFFLSKLVCPSPSLFVTLLQVCGSKLIIPTFAMLQSTILFSQFPYFCFILIVDPETRFIIIIRTWHTDYSARRANE